MQPLLLQLHQNTKLSMGHDAAVYFLAWRECHPDFNMVRLVLPTLTQLNFGHTEEVLLDAYWVWNYLSDGPNENISKHLLRLVCVCRRLVNILLHPSHAQLPPNILY